MRVLVTGCGGFLGGEIVRQLLARGDQVVGVSRGAYPSLVERGMQHLRGDLTNREFTIGAIEGVDAVIHTAAIAGVWGPWHTYYSTNKLATDYVIEGCRNAGVRSLVFSSTPSVTFDGRDQSGIDESAPYPDRWLCHYPHTKALAEQAVIAAHQPGQLNTVSLRPHLIWGENDPHLLPRVLDRARRGRLRIVGRGDNLVDTVHVVNAAAAHLDALDAIEHSAVEAGGRCYFITNDEPVDCWKWLQGICEIGGVAPPSKKIPLSVAYAIGGALEAAYKMTARTNEPPMSRFVALQLARHHYFDINAAKQRLGYHVRVSMDEGLKKLRQAWRS